MLFERIIHASKVVFHLSLTRPESAKELEQQRSMAFMTPVLEDVKGSPGAPERQNSNFLKEDDADGLEEGAQSSRGMADESHKDGLQGPGLGGGSSPSQGMADESHQDGLQGLGLGGGSTPSQGMAGHCKNCASKEDKQKEVQPMRIIFNI